jgi:hypothetical protein
MKRAIVIIFLLGIAGLCKSVSAQIILTKQYATQHNLPFAKDLPADTVYYYLDTAAVPKHDPKIKILTESDGKKYAIYCQCVQDYDKNIYLFNPLEKRVLIDDKKFKMLKIWTLTNFVSFMQDQGIEAFGKNYKVYFIEPLNGKYLVNQVYNASGEITIID